MRINVRFKLLLFRLLSEGHRADRTHPIEMRHHVIIELQRKTGGEGEYAHRALDQPDSVAQLGAWPRATFLVSPVSREEMHEIHQDTVLLAGPCLLGLFLGVEG